jgi:hypothetical protein
MKKAILSLAVLFSLAAAAFSQNVFFKLNSGLSWLGGSDLNDGLAGETAAFRAAAGTVSGGFEPVQSGLGGQMEIITRIKARWGVGLAGGYYRVSKVSSISGSGLAADGTPFEATALFNARVSVLPFGINLHYFLPLGDRLTLDAYAGPSFAVVQFNAANPTTTTIGHINKLVTFTASQTALGGQIGLGLAWRLRPGVAVIADAAYRMQKAGDLQGNWAQSGTSDAGAITGASAVYSLWTYRLEGRQRIGFYDQTGPTDAGVSEARTASIDLSGPALTAGIRLSF